MIFRFLDHELDTTKNELLRAGAVTPLSPKPFAVLEFLIRNRDRMVPKSELMDHFWPANVSEAALQTTIRTIRKALGADAGITAIKTYHGHGFRFVADLAGLEDAPSDVTALPEAGVRERRLITMLVIKTKATAAAAEGDQTEALVATVRALVLAEGGTLQRLSIDGLSASFGLGEHADDAVRRCLRCAWDILGSDAAEALGDALQIGVDAGVVELPDAGEAAAWTVPSGLERAALVHAHHAAPAYVHFSQAVFAQLRDELQAHETPEGYTLRARPEDRAGTRAFAAHAGAPFVGRDAELAFLRGSAAAALSGRGQLVVLSGPAGIGKSRLVRTFLEDDAAARRATTMVHCLPRTTNTPLAPVRSLLRSVQSQGGGNNLQDDIDLALLERLIAPARPPAPCLHALPEQVIQRCSRDVFVRVMQDWCAAAPRILVVEDAHWIDAASRAFFGDLIDRIDRLPLLLVVTNRPSERAQVADTVLNLPPLGASDGLALLSGLSNLGGFAQIEDTHAQSLVARAAGNPFFLEELAFATLDLDAKPDGMPETVQAVVESRIAALMPDLRRVLYAMAVIGPPAPVDLISDLLGVDHDTVAARRDQLARLGFVTTDGDDIAFRHMLLHDTAYGMIAPADLRAMHRQVATLREAGDGDVMPEILAWHWQEAAVTDRAIACWTKASNAALSRSAGQAAIHFARQGLTLVTPTDPQAAAQEQGLQLSLATALMARSGYPAEAVGHAYDRALELSEKTGSVKARLRALLGLWVHTWTAGRLTDSQAHGQNLLEIAERIDDPHLKLQGHGGVGSVLFHAGDLDHAHAHLSAGADIIAEAPPDSLTVQNAAVTCMAYRAWLDAVQGRHKDMQGFVAQSDALSQCIENPFAVAIHKSLCAGVLMCAGDVEGCAKSARDAIALSTRYGYPFWHGTGLVLEAWALAHLGETDRAIDGCATGIRIFEETSASIQRANWFGVLAEIQAIAGQPDESARSITRALECAAKTGDTWYVPRILSVAERLDIQAGRDAEAAVIRRQIDDLIKTRKLGPSFTALTHT